MCKRESKLKYYRSVKGICSRSFNHCKDRVKKYRLDFDLDLEYLKSIYPKDSKCPILGYVMKPSQGLLGGDNYSPTLDRRDPKKGYVKGNVEFVCSLYLCEIVWLPVCLNGTYPLEWVNAKARHCS